MVHFSPRFSLYLGDKRSPNISYLLADAIRVRMYTFDGGPLCACADGCSVGAS